MPKTKTKPKTDRPLSRKQQNRLDAISELTDLGNYVDLDAIELRDLTCDWIRRTENEKGFTPFGNAVENYLNSLCDDVIASPVVSDSPERDRHSVSVVEYVDFDSPSYVEPTEAKRETVIHCDDETGIRYQTLTDRQHIGAGFTTCHENTVSIVPETIQYVSADWTYEQVLDAYDLAIERELGDYVIARLQRELKRRESERYTMADSMPINTPNMSERSFNVGDNRPYRLPIRIEPVNPDAMPYGDCTDPIQWDRNVRGTAKRESDQWPADVYCGPIKVANLRGPMPC